MSQRDIERLRALENDLREESRKDAAHGANKEWAEWLRERYMSSASAKWDAAQRIATLIAELGQEVGAVADEYGWVEGPPHRILSKEEGEWFIAETTYGDRVVLKGLPEEYAYDFTTADSTYIKRELIKRWRQFPDSEYKPLGETSPAHTSEARDAQVAELIEATRRLTADIEFRIDDPRSQLLDRARRATTAAVGCNCPGSAKVSYLSHAPNCPAREALGKFAAMRQEAE